MVIAISGCELTIFFKKSSEEHNITQAALTCPFSYIALDRKAPPYITHTAPLSMKLWMGYVGETAYAPPCCMPRAQAGTATGT